MGFQVTFSGQHSHKVDNKQLDLLRDNRHSPGFTCFHGGQTLLSLINGQSICQPLSDVVVQ